MWSKGKKCEQIRLDISENVLRNSILKNNPKISKKLVKSGKNFQMTKLQEIYNKRTKYFNENVKKKEE